MTTVSEFLEDILEKCGGLGRFQWLLLASIIGGKITITWTTLMMSFAGAIPEWSCKWGNETDIHKNITTKPKTCTPPKNFTELGCVERVYDIEMNTVVSEVCIGDLKLYNDYKYFGYIIGYSLKEIKKAQGS